MFLSVLIARMDWGLSSQAAPFASTPSPAPSSAEGSPGVQEVRVGPVPAHARRVALLAWYQRHPLLVLFRCGWRQRLTRTAAILTLPPFG